MARENRRGKITRVETPEHESRTVRLPVAMMERLREIAIREDRTINNVIARLLRAALGEGK